MRINRLTQIFLINAIMVTIPVTVMAQSALEERAQEQRNPIERIMVESSGNVEINIPDNILELIMSDKYQPKTVRQQPVLRPGINKIAGYRIQVFSDGRNQSSLESRAKARGNSIVAKFPKYRGQVYTISSSPNWYTRIGNFRTHEEANAALSELKRAFPSIAAEMRVVKSPIVVISK